MHAYNVAALAEHIEGDCPLHLLKACYQEPLHIEHVQTHRFGARQVETAAFYRKRDRIRYRRHGIGRMLTA